MSYGKTGCRMTTKAVYNSRKVRRDFIALTHADHRFNYYHALALSRASAAPHGTQWDARSMVTDSYSGGLSGVLFLPAFLRSTGFRGFVQRPIGVGALDGIKIFSLRALRCTARPASTRPHSAGPRPSSAPQPVCPDTSASVAAAPCALPPAVTRASILTRKNRARHLIGAITAGLIGLASTFALSPPQQAHAEMIFELKYFNHLGQETTNFWYSESPLITPTNTLRCYVDSTTHPTCIVNLVEWDLTFKTNYGNFIDATLPSSNDFFEGFAMYSPYNRVDNTPKYISYGRILLDENVRLTANAYNAPSNRYRCVGEFQWTPKRPIQQINLFYTYSDPRLRGPPNSDTLYPVTLIRPYINIIPEPGTSLLILFLAFLRKRNKLSRT